MNALDNLLNWIAPLINPLGEFRSQVAKLTSVHTDSVNTFNALAASLVAVKAGPEAFTGEAADTLISEIEAYLQAESALVGTDLGAVGATGVVSVVEEAAVACEGCVAELTTAAEVAAAEVAGDAVLDEVTAAVDVAAVAEGGANPIADAAAIILTIIAGAALIGTLIKMGWDIYHAIQSWQRAMHNAGDQPLPALPAKPTPVPVPPVNLTLDQQKAAKRLQEEFPNVPPHIIEELLAAGLTEDEIRALLQSGSAAILAYVLASIRSKTLDHDGLKQLLREAKLAQRVIDDAKSGKTKKAKNYHGRLPSDLEAEILSNPDAVYVAENGRFIFRKGGNIVVTEGAGSGRGSIVTSYGPGGPRGESGAAALGGSPSDPGEPITDDMIINGKIPDSGGGTLPPARKIFP